MTIAQKIILKFVKDNFDDMRCLEESPSRMKVIDREGTETILGINLFGDILEMTPDGAKIIAVSDLPHNLDEIMRRPTAVPTSWEVAKGKDKSWEKGR